MWCTPSCELVVNVLFLFISNYTQDKNSARDSLFGWGNKIGNFWQIYFKSIVSVDFYQRINITIFFCVEPCNFIESRNSNLNVNSPFLHFLHLILSFSSNQALTIWQKKIWYELWRVNVEYFSLCVTYYLR